MVYFSCPFFCGHYNKNLRLNRGKTMSEEIEALRQRILALAPTTVTRPTLDYFDIIGIA